MAATTASTATEPRHPKAMGWSCVCPPPRLTPLSWEDVSGWGRCSQTISPQCHPGGAMGVTGKGRGGDSAFFLSSVVFKGWGGLMLKYLLSPPVPGVGPGAAAYLAIKGTLWGSALLCAGRRETGAWGGLRDSCPCLPGGIQAPWAGRGEKEALSTPQLSAAFIRAAPVHSLGGEGVCPPAGTPGPPAAPAMVSQGPVSPGWGGTTSPSPSTPASPEALPWGGGGDTPCVPHFYITVLLKHRQNG